MRGIQTFLFLMLLLLLVSGLASHAQDGGQGSVYGNDLKIAPATKEFHGSSERFVKRSGKTCTSCHDDLNYPRRDFFESESITKWTVLWILTTLGLLTFAVGIISRISIWTLGQSKSLHKRIRWSVVGTSLFTWVIFERKVFRMSFWRWFNFFCISIGFILLFVVFIFSATARSLFGSPFFLEGFGANVLDFSMDFLGVMVLVGTLSALIRRYVFTPERLINRAEDLSLLVLLFFIVASGFVLEAVRLAAFPWYPEMSYSFVGNALAHLIRDEQTRWVSVHFYLWLIHGASALIFIAAIPFTKIMHFITAPLTILSTASEEPMHEFRSMKSGME